MAQQIQVTLNINANPPVTVNPSIAEINRGNHTVEWTASGNTQAFSFYSLTGLPNPPFSTPTVTSSQITVTDNNGGAASYTYVLTVQATSNGQYYSTSGSVAAQRPIPGENRLQGGNDPTIRNN